MPVLNIDGVGKVKVGDDFNALSADEKDAFVSSVIADHGRGVRSSLGGGSIQAPDDTPAPMTFADRAADVAKSAGTGLAKGAMGVMGALGDAGRFAEYAPAWLMAHGAEKLGLLPAGKTAADMMADADAIPLDRAPLNSATTLGKPMSDTLGKTLDDSPLGFAAPAIRAVAPYVAAAAPAIAPIARGLDQDSLPTTRQITDTAQGILGPMYQPQTKFGHVAQTVGEFLPGAVAGSSSLVGAGKDAVRYGIAPAFASEAAGNLTEGTAAEPYARGAAALATGGAAGLLTAPGAQARTIANATRGATDAHVSAAGDLMRSAQIVGVPLTWPEALQHVTNGATGAGRLQRVVEGTREGSAITAPFFAQRPDQVARAVGNTLDTIGPATSPARAGIAGQEAATGVLGEMNRRINAAERPYYDAASTRSVPIDHPALQQVSSDPAFQQALQNVRGDPIRNKDIANFGANDVPVLIAVRKEMTRMEDRAMNPGGGRSPDRELARGITPVRDRLDQVITAHAPEYGQALGVGAGLRQQVADPLQRGPIGQIAASPTVEGQTRALFPAQPFEGQPAETARAVGLMGAVDPASGPALVRQHLASTFANANRNLQPGPNQFGGAKFASGVAGNPLQRDTLNAGIGALPNGPEAQQAVGGLLDVLSATGKRQQPGSLTAFNRADLESMGAPGGLASVAGSAIKGDVPGLLGALRDSATRARLGSRVENVARGLLAQPDEAMRGILGARAAVPDGMLGRGVLGLLMGSKPALVDLEDRRVRRATR